MSQYKRPRLTQYNEDNDEYNGETTKNESQMLEPQLMNEKTDGLERKVKDLVRYALACEHKKVVIRREDIKKKVLQDRSRQFNIIFGRAQEKLYDVFGMTLLELPVNEKTSKANTTTAPASSQSTSSPSIPTKPSSSNYILCNSLNKQEYTASGLIHQTDEQYESLGLLYFILSLIFVNEQELEEEELKRLLGRAGVKERTATFGDLDKTLALYVKQGYLQRSKDVGGETNIYQWGPRSKTELSSKDLARFIASIYRTEDVEAFEKDLLKAAGL
ncbi:MAGE family-domain-containing protein [Halteromyces radiatus]|uniref:MAGE family-domain-containing protein n=1 Tax=Halteromyces radiatus TaxID=101107 RepID=UPI00221F7412|nr:MAGE family-domain-containing protein [Halteromyces radiatus]KAI8079973.1 MAGE family-domain-containing protein [Halteromyces radiatus]